MPDFLRPIFTTPPDLTVPTMVTRLVAAMVLGALVAWIYRRTRPESDLAASFPKTLVLLSILIAMVTQVIGDNTALAFSLVGALSIVRFRTVVRDTQDTAFVIFAVAVGMAVGADHGWIALGGLVVGGLAAFLMRSRPASAEGAAWFLLSVRVGLGHDINTLIGPTLDSHLSERRLMSLATVRQGMSIDVSYEARLGRDRHPDELVKALNRIEGVQNVELQRRAIEEG
jgi:hypothetical protein